MASAPAIPPARSDWQGSVAVSTDSIEAARRVQHAAIRQVLREGGPQIVFQPQLSLSHLAVEGYEALARFPESPLRGPEQWFSRARELGMGAALEASALQCALRQGRNRPADSTLAINLSPGVLTSAAVAAVLPADLSGIEIELTEHEWAAGRGGLRRQLDLLRERGASVAIDDVGVAHSGLRRVMELAPDRIKLDRHLVRGISTSTAKAALIRALVYLADHIGAGVVAEGVETVDDLEALADLDVGYAQGWVVGLPEPMFRGADPIAIAAGRESLNVMLLGRANRSTVIDGGPPPAATHDSTTGVDELLVELTTVRSLAELGALVGTCAGVLGGDNLLVSVLTEDGKALAAVPNPVPHPNPISVPAGGSYLLADYPITERCLQTRAATPIYLGTTGDPAEWAVLTDFGYRGALLVPVISRNRVLGLLECYRLDASPWSRRQIRSARTVAAMLGPVLDLTLDIR